jgi:hypothetical protein
MASFVLDTGTTSFAQTYPANAHSNMTNPIEANIAPFGIMASYETTPLPPDTSGAVDDVHDDANDDGDVAPTSTAA